MLILKTRTTDIAVLDKKQNDQSDSFVIAAVAKRDQLEREGILCRHETQQSKESPEQNEEFIGTNIEQLWNFTETDGSTKNIWCKGTVVGVSNNKKYPKIRIKWDTVYLRPGEPEVSEEVLLKTKWNKQTEKSWRLNLDNT